MVTFDGDIVEEAAQRLKDAGLIPPVTAVELAGPGPDSDAILVSVAAELEPGLISRISAAMGPLPHALCEVSGSDGVFYGGG